jgi:hypothetical protein
LQEQVEVRSPWRMRDTGRRHSPRMCYTYPVGAYHE